jgi:long-chain acyl-CoA synthetase
MATPRATNLVTMLAKSVHDYGDRPLFGTRSAGGWSWMSYAEFGRRVDALRAGLASLGVVRGDCVAVISRNRVEWSVGCYATAGLGAAYVPMYEEQAERDWKHILADSAARVCLVSGAAVGPRVASLVNQLQLPSVKHVVDLDAPTDDPRGYSGLSAWGEAHPAQAVSLEDSALAELVYTSGTTGRPKGVRLTHANIVSNVEAVIRVLPVSCEDRSLSFLPWAHVFGADELHGITSIGASLAICDSIPDIGRDLTEVRPTLLFAVPRIWNRVYQGVRRTLSEQPRIVRAVFERGTQALRRRKRGEKLSVMESIALELATRLVLTKIRGRFGGRLRLAVSAAAALSPDVAEFIDDLGIMILEAYGLTESSACATINRPDDRRRGSVGKPIPGVRIELDRAVRGAEGGAGEIVVYGHGVMAGYQNLPAETASALTSDGGLRTGDLGRFDGDGFLYITGRLKELYKLENGKYVAPASLEEQLTLSPYIDQVFVYGADMPHNVALVVPNQQALLTWARAHSKGGLTVGPLLADPDVRSVFRAEIEASGHDFRGYERIQAFALIEEPFSTDNGLLTPTLKVRRGDVLKRYRPVLDALYAPNAPTQPTMATTVPLSH